MKSKKTIRRMAQMVRLGRNKRKMIMITFPYNSKDVERVKTLPNRKFHKQGILRYWTCTLCVEALEDLKDWGFELSPQLLTYLDEAIIDINEINQARVPGIDHLLYPYQKEGIAFIEKRKGRALIADEMGCIEGDALISINRCGKSFKVNLRDAYHRFNGIGRYKWNPKSPTKARVLKDDHFGLHPIKHILYKGERKVLQVVLSSGKKLRLTPDHEVLTKDGWVEIQNLSVGDSISVNGQPKCKMCGGIENITTYKYAKFKGYCKTCINTHLKHCRTRVESTKRMGTDGYVYLKGTKYHDHPRYTSGGLLEHIYVMEQHIGRFITKDEEVHHINKIRHDNRIENLKLVGRSQHSIEHRTFLHFDGGKSKSGGDIILIPKKEQIVSIKDAGTTDVYDIVMEDPHRNFVANGIVVHNCGKTIQALGWLRLHPEKRPAIIVVPASLKINWMREVKKWLVDPNVEILSGTKPYQITSNIVIINYDIIKEWQDALKSFGAKVLVVDEAHYIKNNKAQRTAALKKIAKKIPHVITLTGTPVLSRPIEIYNAIQIVDRSIFPSWYRYTRRYCDAHNNGYGINVQGASHTDELHRKLTKTVMLRRLKEDVLEDLPEKVRSFIPMEMSDRTEYDKIEQDFIKWIIETKGAKAARRYKGAQALTKIEALKQAAVKAKYKAVVQWITDFLNTEDKLVVFTTHTFTVDWLMDQFAGQAVRVDGSVTGTKRQEAIDKFWNDPKIKLFVGNIKAAGVGLNLQVAHSVAFIELGWTPGEHDQASDRVHRIGQTHDSVNVYYLLATNTIEEKIATLIDSKRVVVDKILDGIETEKEKLLAILMDEYYQEQTNP